MKTLFVTDLDGTLLTKEQRVSAYSCEHLNRLIGDGLLFTFATARSAESAKNATQGLNINAPVVLYNGGLLYDFATDTTLRAILLNEEEKCDILDVLNSFNISPFAYSALEGREKVKWITERETEGIIPKRNSSETMYSTSTVSARASTSNRRGTSLNTTRVSSVSFTRRCTRTTFGWRSLRAQPQRQTALRS